MPIRPPGDRGHRVTYPAPYRPGAGRAGWRPGLTEAYQNSLRFMNPNGKEVSLDISKFPEKIQNRLMIALRGNPNITNYMRTLDDPQAWIDENATNLVGDASAMSAAEQASADFLKQFPSHEDWRAGLPKVPTAEEASRTGFGVVQGGGETTPRRTGHLEAIALRPRNNQEEFERLVMPEQEDRRVAENRRVGQRRAQERVGADRRMSERRRMEMWMDADQPDVLGPEPSLLEQSPDFAEWEALGDEDFQRASSNRTTGSSDANFDSWRDNRVLKEVGYEEPKARIYRNVLSQIAEEQGLGGFWKGVPSASRLAKLGAAGTAADALAAYSLTPGSERDKMMAAGKSAAVGAGMGAAMQGAGKLAVRAALPGAGLGAGLLGWALPAAGALYGGWQAIKAGRGYLGQKSAEREAEKLRQATFARYPEAANVRTSDYGKGYTPKQYVPPEDR